MAFRLFLFLKVIYCSGDEEVHKTRSEEKVVKHLLHAYILLNQTLVADANEVFRV